jgi:hypothetical protein
MLKRITVKIVVATLILVLTQTAHGWNNQGHMMVAAVAYQLLDQHTRERVDALLLLNPDHDNWLRLIPAGTSAKDKKMMVFMIAATWPDRIKSNNDYHSDGPAGGNRPPTDGTANNNIGYTDFALHKYWHFVDVPFSPDGTTLPEVPTPNAQTRINDFRAVLASNSPDDLKSYDLSWLLHLVGDIHQPLHGTTRVTHSRPNGDDGGNAVKLVGSPNNLHSFWDGSMGNSNFPKDAKTAAAALQPASAAAANDLDVAHWVKESFDAKTTVYKNPPIGPGLGPFTPTTSYKQATGALAKKRIALAGARLAKILNQELK